MRCFVFFTIVAAGMAAEPEIPPAKSVEEATNLMTSADQKASERATRVRTLAAAKQLMRLMSVAAMAEERANELKNEAHEINKEVHEKNIYLKVDPEDKK